MRLHNGGSIALFCIEAAAFFSTTLSIKCEMTLQLSQLLRPIRRTSGRTTESGADCVEKVETGFRLATIESKSRRRRTDDSRIKSRLNHCC